MVFVFFILVDSKVVKNDKPLQLSPFSFLTPQECLDMML